MLITQLVDAIYVAKCHKGMCGIKTEGALQWRRSYAYVLGGCWRTRFEIQDGRISICCIAPALFNIHKWIRSGLINPELG